MGHFPDIIDLADIAAERAAISEIDGELPREHAVRRSFAGAVKQLPGADHDLAVEAARWVIADCPFAGALAAVALQSMLPPYDWPADRWTVLRGDVLTFCRDGWAAKAESAGWEPWEVWGCCRDAPYGRLQGHGLVAGLGGAVVSAITESEASLTMPSGSILKHRRKLDDPLHSNVRAMLWDVAKWPDLGEGA